MAHFFLPNDRPAALPPRPASAPRTMVAASTAATPGATILMTGTRAGPAERVPTPACDLAAAPSAPPPPPCPPALAESSPSGMVARRSPSAPADSDAPPPAASTRGRFRPTPTPPLLPPDASSGPLASAATEPAIWASRHAATRVAGGGAGSCKLPKETQAPRWRQGRSHGAREQAMRHMRPVTVQLVSPPPPPHPLGCPMASLHPAPHPCARPTCRQTPARAWPA
jgi:hypothetical protein